MNEVIEGLTGHDTFLLRLATGWGTGEHFMEFPFPDLSKRYCTPNAILTLTEYLVDYAPEKQLRKAGK